MGEKPYYPHQEHNPRLGQVNTMTEAPDIQIALPGPKAKEIVKRDTDSIGRSTKTSEVVAQSAKGSLIKDVDGNPVQVVQYVTAT